MLGRGERFPLSSYSSYPSFSGSDPVEFNAWRTGGIQEALRINENKGLEWKCTQMHEILEKAHVKDLKTAFPAILHEIFDFEKDNSQGWQLDTVYKNNNPERFRKVLRLLAPGGPLMNAIHAIQLSDPYGAYYPFPYKCLPAPTRALIDAGHIPDFYVNKLHKQNYLPIVMLNTFELFIFHLAYALVSPVWQLRNESWSDLYNYIYPTLVDSLLLYFLPCDQSSLPRHPYYSSHLLRPSVSFHHKGHAGQGSPQGGNVSSSPHNSLFKSSFLQAQRQHQQSLPAFDQAEAEVWHSETLLKILTEFWLNQNSINSGEKKPVFASGLQEYFLPTANHVKMVRLIVKHLHHFANSTTNRLTSLFQPVITSPLDQFKRSVIPHILQKKLYIFLRHSFERWPLDSCFRMVLETWLSYIQPWRYTEQKTWANSGGSQSAETENIKEVDGKWGLFVEDNLLFYTVLFKDFMARIYRMDLTTPHSAYMVYRVARIFTLRNLAKLISQAEQKLIGGTGMSVNLGGSYLSNQTSYLSNQTSYLSMTTPPHMTDLEGPNFQYVSIFHENVKNVMNSVVLCQLTAALEAVRADLVKTNKAQTRSRVWYFVFMAEPVDSSKLYTKEEYKRMSMHLEQAIFKFCSLYSLQTPDIVFLSDENTDISQSNASNYLSEESLHPEVEPIQNGWRLTDRGRLQLINREKKFEEFYVGDPERHPIRSYENAMLVRIFYHICAFLNSFFCQDLNNLYNRQGFVGNFARVFLISPTAQEDVIQKLRCPLSPHAAVLNQSQQAKINLRFLASYHTLLLLAVVYTVLTVTMDYNLTDVLVVLVGFTCLYGLLVAAWQSARPSLCRLMRHMRLIR